MFCSIYSLVFSRPDTLLNLSMNCLQREAIFMDKREYANLLQKLPPNQRPFGQNPVVESYVNNLEQQEPENSRRRSRSLSSNGDREMKKQKPK
jgi:hypothetical protein